MLEINGTEEGAAVDCDIGLRSNNGVLWGGARAGSFRISDDCEINVSRLGLNVFWVTNLRKLRSIQLYF